jgi:hypothetical protein
VREDGAPQFDGVIPTPSRSLVFHGAFLNELLAYPLSTSDTRVRILTYGQMLRSGS